MNDDFQKVKNLVKNVFKAYKKVIIVITLIPFIAIAVLAASVYQIFLHWYPNYWIRNP